jgi:membrane protease YdiL (CAAX protease family)
MKWLCDSPRWRPLATFFAIYVGALLVSIPAAPLFHRGLCRWEEAFPGPFIHYIASKPLVKIFDRTRWVPLAVGLICLLRSQKLCPLRALNLQIPSRWLGVQFFFLGTVLAILPCAIQLLFLPWTWRPTPVLRVFAWALPSAALIGFLEEIVFRGLLFRLALRALRPLGAALLSSLFFASAHFGPPEFLNHRPPNLLSSLQIAGGMLLGVGFTFHLLPFLFLASLGLLLTHWVKMFSSLIPSIGFHCGLVFILLIHRRLFFFLDTSPNFFLGSGHPIDSPIPLLLLGFCFLVIRPWRSPARLS